MQNIIAKLAGKKTYILSAITIIYAVSGLILGYIDQASAIQLILGALTAAGIRNAIK